MKGVLISIRPEWIQKIFSGEKTIEVRKTFPKLPPPFKCFIYCTKPRYDHEDILMTMTGPLSYYWGGGKVVGEFICDAVEKIDMDSVGLIIDRTKEYTDWNPCMTRGEFLKYTGGMKPYGWHISDLKVYDKPKPLSDFGGVCKERLNDEHACGSCKAALRNFGHCPFDHLKRPPQSWQYAMLC